MYVRLMIMNLVWPLLVDIFFRSLMCSSVSGMVFAIWIGIISYAMLHHTKAICIKLLSRWLSLLRSPGELYRTLLHLQCNMKELIPSRLKLNARW